MKVVISGGSGLIGQALAASLSTRAEVAVLTRNPGSVSNGRPVEWNPLERGRWTEEVAAADVVINLAGAGIADKRWSRARKKEIRDSRIDATRGIVDAIAASPESTRPILVSASAVGYYGARGDIEVDEESKPGEGFLAELCVDWEREARKAESVTRVILARIGFVLAIEGGALPEMLPIFRLGLGGPLGSGHQWMSWIHIDDVVGMIEAAVSDRSFEGPLNVVAPQPVTNAQFTRELGGALRRPALLPAPGFALRIVVGELAGSLVTGQRVVAAGAKKLGYEFRFASLSAALTSLCARL